MSVEHPDTTFVPNSPGVGYKGTVFKQAVSLKCTAMFPNMWVAIPSGAT